MKIVIISGCSTRLSSKEKFKDKNLVFWLLTILFFFVFETGELKPLKILMMKFLHQLNIGVVC